MLPNKVATAIIVMVAVMEAVNFAAQFIAPLHYTSDPSVHAIFGAIVGGALALRGRGGGAHPPTGSVE